MRALHAVVLAAMIAALAVAETPANVYKCVGSTASCQNATNFLQNGHDTKLCASLNAAYATRRNGGTVSPKQAEYIGSAGRFTYDEDSASTSLNTLYDMASCSKIMATTTAVAQLYQSGHLSLDDKVASEKLLGERFSSQGKGAITIRNLMLHNAGFPPDPVPGYSAPEFGCPQSALYYPGQDFSCNARILKNLIENQTLVYPTGTQFIYSDLSMITAMFVVGKVTKDNKLVDDKEFPPVCKGFEDHLSCQFYAYVDKFVFKRYNLTNTSYIPSSPINTPPAWVSTNYHHGLIMGYVSDQNAYALGGISGHAGVFSTVSDSLAFMKVWMDITDPDMLNATTVKLFTTVANLTQSSRALGWDTNNQPSPPCGSLSKATFFHIGYTGTQFCGDPVNGIMTVLHGNGRFPDFSVDGTIILRPEFNSLVLDMLSG